MSDAIDGIDITMKAPESEGGAMITDFEDSADGGNSWAGVDRDCVCILLDKLAAAHATKSFNGPIEATWKITRQSGMGTPKLVAGESYKVQVRAVNSAGVGKHSNTMSATVLAPTAVEAEAEAKASSTKVVGG